MALAIAQHAGTKTTIKNTFLEFTCAAEDATGGPGLRRTHSSPCIGGVCKDVSCCEAVEADADASWCEGPWHSEDPDADSCGSSDNLGPTEHGPPLLLSDLLQVESWPCPAVKKSPPDGGSTPSVMDARAPLDTCFGGLSKDVRWCDAMEMGTDTGWCERPGRSEAADTESCGSSDNLTLSVKGPTEHGLVPLLLSDLLQIEPWPCSAAKKSPDGGVTPSAMDARASASKSAPEGGQALRRTPLSTKAVAYVPRDLAATGGAPPAAANGDSYGRTPTPSWPAPSTPAQPAAWHVASVHKKAAHGESCVQRTTVMLKNLPPPYTREMLIDLLESQGFLRHCNFVYLPVNFKRVQNVGYAFLNLTSEEQTRRFFDVFDGFNDWVVESDQVSSVSWSATQGLSENIERYRNSPIMREEVPDSFKPVLISGGSLLSFPQPTKQLRNLRCRKGHGMPRHGESAGAEECGL